MLQLSYEAQCCSCHMRLSAAAAIRGSVLQLSYEAQCCSCHTRLSTSKECDISCTPYGLQCSKHHPKHWHPHGHTACAKSAELPAFHMCEPSLSLPLCTSLLAHLSPCEPHSLRTSLLAHLSPCAPLSCAPLSLCTLRLWVLQGSSTSFCSRPQKPLQQTLSVSAVDIKVHKERGADRHPASSKPRSLCSRPHRVGPQALAVDGPGVSKGGPKGAPVLGKTPCAASTTCCKTKRRKLVQVARLGCSCTWSRVQLLSASKGPALLNDGYWLMSSRRAGCAGLGENPKGLHSTLAACSAGFAWWVHGHTQGFRFRKQVPWRQHVHAQHTRARTQTR